MDPELEFHCPQYYDFENETDDSHPEVFFETRQSRYGFSPSSARLSSEDSTDSKGSLESKVFSPLSTFNCGPSYNTRQSVKREQETERKSERVMKRISSKFQSLKEPPIKKIALAPLKTFKQPLMIKRERGRSSILSAKERRRRAAYKLTRSNSANTLTRTVPAPFSFSTDRRVKMESHDIPEYKHVDFGATLRSNKENQNHVRTGPVRAIPERLLRKRKVTDKKTMGEEVLSFPQGLSNRVKPSTPPDTRGAKCLKLTQPVTPSLRVASRSRPVHVISQEEKESMEAEEMKKYHFKAQPIKAKLKVPFVVKKRKVEKPEAVEMVLATEKRAALRPRTTSLVESAPEFHARPVPKKILQGVTGLGEKVSVKLTEPQSPPFVLKKREVTWKHLEAKQREVEAAAAALEAQNRAPRLRLRTHSNSSLHTSLKKEPTIPAPFSFHLRDQNTLARKEERIHHLFEEEKKAREFRANPVPSPSVNGLPQKKKISPTKFQNFTLELENLAPYKIQRWQKRLEEEARQEKEATKFKAHPCTVTRSEPFIPSKSNKPATEFESFDLHSELRASQRSKYDQELKQKAEERQALLEEQKRQEEELEMKQIMEMRAKAVHKANPVLRVEPFLVKRGLIPTTEPIAPEFKTDKRLNRKRRHE